MALGENPATGQTTDDWGRSPPGGLVSQQDNAAAASPTFIGPPMDAANPPPTVPIAPDAPMSPDNGSTAAPPLTSGNGVPILADDGQASAPGAGEPPGAPTLQIPIPDGAVEPITPSGPGPNEVIPSSPDDGIGAAPGAPPPTTPGVDAANPGEAEKPKELIDERIDAAKREGEVKKELARLEAEKAQADFDQKKAAKEETDKLISQAEQRIAEGRARRDAEYAKYKDMSVQDAWGDNGIAKRVLAGLAMILGGRNGMAVVIGAAQGLEENKKTQLALQEKVATNAGKSLEEIKDQNAEEMVNFNDRMAAAYGVTAARLEHEKRAQGIPEAQIQTDQNILNLRAEEDKRKLAAQKLDIDRNNEKLKMELVQASIREKNSIANKNDRYVQKGGKGAGGGGGTGGGPGITDRAKAVADAITNGVEGEDGKRRELTYGEKLAVAKANGIKPNGKSSETTLDTINKTVAFDANAARKGGAAEDKKKKAQTERETNVIKNPWTGDMIGPAPSTRGLTVARKDQAAGVQLVDTLKEYRDHLAKYGANVGVFGSGDLSRQDILAERKRLWADAAGNRRVWSNLPSSEAGLDLEKAQMGGTGKLWDIQPTSVHSIDQMIAEVQRVTNQRSNILAGKPANWKPPAAEATPAVTSLSTPGAAPVGDVKAYDAQGNQAATVGSNGQKAKDIQSGYPVDRIKKARAAAVDGNPNAEKAKKWLTDRGLPLQ